MLSKDEFREFLADQKAEMDLAKWYEGERIGKDPGTEFLLWWIRSSAAKFRSDWEREHGTNSD